MAIFSKTHGLVQDLCYLCKSHNVENCTISTEVRLRGKTMWRQMPPVFSGSCLQGYRTKPN